MKISAVITLYNKAPYIERCLRSVMAQTHLPCEIIVVNDVSSDGGDIIAEKTLKKSPVPWVLHNRENRGGANGPAENTGVRISRGKFIAFLDGDDEWAPGHLENIVRLIDRYPNADAYSSSRQLRKGSTCLPCPYALKSKRNDTHVFDFFVLFTKTIPLAASASSLTIFDKRVIKESFSKRVSASIFATYVIEDCKY